MPKDDTEQLRRDINEALSSEQPKEQLLLPDACNRAALTPEQQETAFENWVEHIYSRDQSTWTRQECAVIRMAAFRAARTL